MTLRNVSRKYDNNRSSCCQSEIHLYIFSQDSTSWMEQRQNECSFVANAVLRVS